MQPITSASIQPARRSPRACESSQRGLRAVQPKVSEVIRYTGDFFEPDFEFSIRALTRGLIAWARHARKHSSSPPLTERFVSTSSRERGNVPCITALIEKE